MSGVEGAEREAYDDGEAGVGPASGVRKMPRGGGMKRWKMFTILNAWALVGAFLAIFTIPPGTSLWIWAACSIGAILLFNVTVYRWLRRRS